MEKFLALKLWRQKKKNFHPHFHNFYLFSLFLAQVKSIFSSNALKRALFNFYYAMWKMWLSILLGSKKIVNKILKCIEIQIRLSIESSKWARRRRGREKNLIKLLWDWLESEFGSRFVDKRVGFEESWGLKDFFKSF